MAKTDIKEREKNQDSEIAYKREAEYLKKIEEVIANDALTSEEVRSEMKDMYKSYKRMVQDMKLLTSVGDRLQKKLKSANILLQEQSEEIQRINKDVAAKNIELQLTIDELTKAKAGRRATTIILISAVALFAVSEVLENLFQSISSGSMYLIYLFKISLVLGFKPFESWLEDGIIKQELKRQREEEAKEKSELEAQTTTVTEVKVQETVVEPEKIQEKPKEEISPEKEALLSDDEKAALKKKRMEERRAQKEKLKQEGDIRE